MNKKSCISLIGMPGSGKSTIGKILAKELGYAFIDSDFLLEALYARPLQNLTDIMEREAFLDAEASIIRAIQATESVIATGGSVIYRPEAMRHLQKLGRIIYLAPPLAVIEERVSCKPDRGISCAPGQGLAELYAERACMYEKYADITCDSAIGSPAECMERLVEML